jgi:hypothetical protein
MEKTKEWFRLLTSAAEMICWIVVAAVLLWVVTCMILAPEGLGTYAGVVVKAFKAALI